MSRNLLKRKQLQSLSKFIKCGWYDSLKKITGTTACLSDCKSFVTATNAGTALKRNLGQPTSFTHPYLMKEDEVTPGLLKQDYAERRKALMKLLHEATLANKQSEGKRNLFILFGQPVVYMSEDIPYPFHQQPNFRYLTGFLEPGSCLIMEGDSESSSHSAMLLVPERDPQKELWHGPRAGVDGAQALTGVDSTESIEKLPQILQSYVSEKHNVWYDYQAPTNLQLHMNYMRKFLTDIFNKKLPIFSPTKSIHQLRHVKTPKEIELMFEAGKITSEAFARALPACFPDMNEGVLHAMLDCECRFKGAQMLAYPPVVAGGNRANTLHYINNNQRIKDGDLVLVDAGAEYHGYVADVTRTWPINGRFSPAQRTLYQSVLNVQKACVEMCRPGTSLDAIYSAMALLLSHELYENGIVKEKPNSNEIYEIVRKFCPHHVGHWLGMDVHDTSTISRTTILEPGMVLTVEPGIYIRSDDTSVPEQYRGIGIRIEDDVVITSEKPLVLTKLCPKEIDDIESLISSL